MTKTKQHVQDTLESENRRSVERELFETRVNQCPSDEYIKQFDIILRKSRDSGNKDRRTSEKADTNNASSAKKESGDFWAGYFHNKPLWASNTSITTKRTSKLKANQTNFDGQDGLDKSDWETWWIRSPLWRRFVGFFLVILFIIFLAQLAMSIFLVSTSIIDDAEDPYLCRTKNCQYLTQWFLASANFSVSPCHDFYEFVCGNHRNENDDESFTFDWDLHTAPIEFGRQNILVEMLRNLQKEKIHDQPIKFYKTCIDSRARDKFGLSGYRKVASDLFGDLNNIDSSVKSLEEMAVEVTEIVGDFGLFEFDFNGFPTILIQLFGFAGWVPSLSTENVTIIESLITFLFPEVIKVKEISEGVYQILNISSNLYNLSAHANTVDDICTLKNQKPFDIQGVLKSYTESDDGEVVTFNDEHRSYYESLSNCWTPPVQNPKSSFAFFWLLRILIHYLNEISPSDFAQIRPYFEGVEIDAVLRVDAARARSIDYQCFESLVQNLGYIPIHRYFEKLAIDRGLFATEIEGFFRRHSLTLHEHWNNTSTFPHIDSFLREVGSEILTFKDPVNFFSNIPSETDIKLEEIVNLDLTDDHFQNAVHGKRFTLSQAKAWWTKLNDRRHVLLWNANTFDLEHSYYTVAPTDKVNSVFLPVTFFFEPYESDILAVRNGGTTVVVMRTILNYLEEYLSEDNLRKKFNNTTPDSLQANDSSSRTCMIYNYDLDTQMPTEMEITHQELYTEHYGLFANVMSIKAAHADSVDRESLKTNSYNHLPPKLQRWEISKKLPGLEQFTEEHLFFMATVRHFCRAVPQPEAYAFPLYQNYITAIRSAFMQIDEFSTAWKCSPEDRMNPPNKCF